MEMLQDPRRSFEIEVFHHPTSLGLKSQLGGLWQAWQSRKKFRTAGLVILQSCLSWGTLFLGYFCCRRATPYILIPRGDFIPAFSEIHLVKNPLAKWFFWWIWIRPLFERAHAVVFTSDLEKGRYEKLGAPIRRACLIPNPAIERTHQAEGQDKNNTSWDVRRPFALCLTRYAREKGLDLLLDAWPEVIRSCPQAMLVIAGSVDEVRIYKRLVKKVREKGLEHSVILSRWIEGSRKGQLLDEARCLLLPSRYESFGNVVIEALRMQTPVIVSDQTPWKHLNGTAGFWLPRRKEIWAERMIHYLRSAKKMSLDPSLTAALLEPYVRETIQSKWQGLISEILGQPEDRGLPDQPASVLYGENHECLAH